MLDTSLHADGPGNLVPTSWSEMLGTNNVVVRIAVPRPGNIFGVLMRRIFPEEAAVGFSGAIFRRELNRPMNAGVFPSFIKAEKL